MELGKFEVFQQIGSLLVSVIRTAFGLLLIRSIGTCQLNDIKRVQILRHGSRARSHSRSILNELLSLSSGHLLKRHLFIQAFSKGV